ncbi:dienelactone hydrolase family protein [Stieleria sp.]|uniref:dienelactone hydrolase family protein n=1 Tax=Stieleria sp. TaxID=2795976 RepID=UPI003561E645
MHRLRMVWFAAIGCGLFGCLIGDGLICCGDEAVNVVPLEWIGKSFQASDSINVGDEPAEDARACLSGLIWQATEFTTHCTTADELRGDVTVRFPSPINTGHPANDSVAMEWYVARDEQQRPKRAKAVVVVHESGSKMPVGRMFAHGFHHCGFHAFLIHLPHYGKRRENGKKPDDVVFFNAMRQGIADVRRARDAVACLPYVDDSSISLQGTSLGGFVSATAASIDDGYDHIFITLAGGNLLSVIENGTKDAAKVRQRLQEAGITGEQLRSLVNQIEPTRVAHRLPPDRTWLYSGTFDTVVPMSSANALATSAKLDPSHHIRLLANHYSGIIYLPAIIDHMRNQIESVK